jgi:Uma2 family endonuclease
MVMPVNRRWTTADVRALQQEDRAWPRYELLDGELLVTPAPRGLHQAAVVEIVRLLDDYLMPRGFAVTLTSPSDIELREGTIMQPDVFVVPCGIAPAGRAATWADVSALVLAVEILSPSTVERDRLAKREFYLANQVEEYWVVDVDARVIERWRATQNAPELCRETMLWVPRAVDALVIDVGALFARIDARWAALSQTGRESGDATRGQ